MLSKRAGIVIAVIAAAILATLIMYALGITGEEAVKDAVQP
jgi:hypothetical protein